MPLGTYSPTVTCSCEVLISCFDLGCEFRELCSRVSLPTREGEQKSIMPFWKRHVTCYFFDIKNGVRLKVVERFDVQTKRRVARASAGGRAYPRAVRRAMHRTFLPTRLSSTGAYYGVRQFIAAPHNIFINTVPPRRVAWGLTLSL